MLKRVALQLSRSRVSACRSFDESGLLSPFRLLSEGSGGEQEQEGTEEAEERAFFSLFSPLSPICCPSKRPVSKPPARLTVNSGADSFAPVPASSLFSTRTWAVFARLMRFSSSKTLAR